MFISDEKYDIIYADPPWRYDFSKSKSRKIENQYPTMTLEEIKSLDVPAANNCILFLWATAPKLTEALNVMQAWGFSYISQLVWDKVKFGMGYWARGQHELLLIGRKGKVSPPIPSCRISSVIRTPRGKHSAKPIEVREWIEKSYPRLKKIELFARVEHLGWSTWGDEV